MSDQSHTPDPDWAFVRQEADAAFRFFHECWVGTGSLTEEGTASFDFQVWKGRMHVVWSLADSRAKATGESQ